MRKQIVNAEGYTLIKINKDTLIQQVTSIILRLSQLKRIQMTSRESRIILVLFVKGPNQGI